MCIRDRYKDASNISARINLHRDYSLKPVSWFEQIFNQCAFESGYSVLELGCGDASLWSRNVERIPANMDILLTDISYGMIRDAVRNLSDNGSQFRYEVMDAHQIYKLDDSFDRIIANHVLFYCDNLDMVCSEVHRVLRPEGIFICSTYGSEHMKEISSLVKEFDDRIELSADRLYDHFGKENGKKQLQKYFSDVSWLQYDDSLYVTDYEPVVEYVLSCHGNQNRFIVDRYKEFVAFVKEKTDKGLRITKDAGVFIAKR